MWRFAICVLKSVKATLFCKHSKRIFILFRKGATFMGSHLAESQLSPLTGVPKKNWKTLRSPDDQPLIGSTGSWHCAILRTLTCVFAVTLMIPCTRVILECSWWLLLQCRMSLNLEGIRMYQSRMLYGRQSIENTQAGIS